MNMSRLFHLPRWPSKGNRRKLEALWLDELETHGTPDGLIQSPSKPPAQLFEAVEQFNGGLFWECHETLEEVWLETPYPLRFFYHAIIKCAVGLHHANRHNRHGARVKLSDAVRLLSLFQPQFLGVRTDILFSDISDWVERVECTDHVDWAVLDALPKPVIQIVD